MITDFVDLSIQVNQETAKMRFLIMDLGIEDAILGYPWLAWFEPNFGWKEGIIDTHFLPIIMWSLNWDEQTKQTICYAQDGRRVWLGLVECEGGYLGVYLATACADAEWD